MGMEIRMFEYRETRGGQWAYLTCFQFPAVI